MGLAMQAPTARPNSPMPIPCSGRRILLLEMAPCARRDGDQIVRIVCTALLLGCAVSAISSQLPAYAGHVLVTEEEAKLPPPKGAAMTDRRGVARGPKVKFVHETESFHSPMHFQVIFESFGGAKIDPGSVRVMYLKTPIIDLTPRIKSFLQTGGIDIPDVELPVGEHIVRVDVKDSDGRIGSTSFVLKVAP